MDNLDFSHGGNIYEARRRFGKNLIDFSASINPLKLPENLQKRLFDRFEEVLDYPDPDAGRITRKIADYWGIKEDNILPGNGSAELIYLITAASKPRTVLIPVPTFSEYERASRMVKSKMIFLRLKEENNFCLNMPVSRKNPDIFFVCNPNNPTGNLLIKNRKGLNIRPNKLLVVDEAFMDFLPDQKSHTFVREAVKDKKIVVMRSFTKFFALPGLRIGYLVAHRDVIAKLKQYQLPWNVNCLAQIAGETVLDDKEYMKRTHAYIEKERKFLLKRLSEFGTLKCYSGEVNFILIKIIKDKCTSEKIKTKLAEKGVLVRDCSNFRNLNGKYIRVAVRSRGENEKLLAALKETL